MKGDHSVAKSLVNIAVIIASVAGIAVAVFQIFGVSVLGRRMIDTAYLYWLAAFFLPLVFLRRGMSNPGRWVSPRWYDIVATIVGFACPFFFFLNALPIRIHGWIWQSPTIFWVLGSLWCLVILEGARRVAGLSLIIFALVIGAWPLFASNMPGLLGGAQFSFPVTIAQHTLGRESILGIPLTVVGQLVIGYMLFAVALQVTGAGTSFLRLASALFGRHRGGAAKVSIFASALFGTISGSAVANVLTTGCITIPAMKKTGIPAHYAAAVEACASTGGLIMPPIMGAVAFVMAEFLGVSYADVAIAAAVPAIAYYLCLFLQLDGWAAKVGLRGIPSEELPTLRQTIKEGWIYIIALAVLVFILFYMREVVKAPFYTAGVLFLLAAIRKETRPDPQMLMRFLVEVGGVLSDLVAVLAAVGFIIGGLTITGIAPAFSGEVVHLAGGNLALLLGLGALSSFVLGMGITVTACYVLLAVLVGPALIHTGLDKMAVHLFILYWGILSCITPPVAMAVYPAANLAGASPIKVGFQAMRLGIMLFILPFFFVLEPALILHGTPVGIIWSILTLVVGIFFIAGALEGYVLVVGEVVKYLRIPLLVSGLLIALPGWQSDIIGLVTGLALIGMNHLILARRPRRQRDVWEENNA